MVFATSRGPGQRPCDGNGQDRRKRDRKVSSSLIRRLGRGASLGSADGSHLSAASASAEEPVAAIGLEPRHTHSRRHLELLEDLSGSRIDPPHVALVAFPSAVPKLAVDPCDAGNDAVGFDGAKNGSRFGIDLMDLPASVLPHPERPFRPCEPRVTAATRRRDRREHTACRRIDLLNAILGDLIQVLAVEAVPACAATSIERTVFPLSGSRALSLSPDANHTCRPSNVTPCMWSAPGKGPYSRRISAADVFMPGV